jgi:hypothetical protein
MHMRKLWLKAWITLDGVFDADTMDHWWPHHQEARTLALLRQEFFQSKDTHYHGDDYCS